LSQGRGGRGRSKGHDPLLKLTKAKINTVSIRAGEPERPEPHDLAGAGAGAILFFLQEPEREAENFKKLEWSRSWHKLMRLRSSAVFKNFVKNNNFLILSYRLKR